MRLVKERNSSEGDSETGIDEEEEKRIVGLGTEIEMVGPCGPPYEEKDSLPTLINLPSSWRHCDYLEDLLVRVLGILQELQNENLGAVPMARIRLRKGCKIKRWNRGPVV